MLPFANLSGDPAQDYFADGVTENLTTDLSRIRGSFVIARNTAFTYKGKADDAKEIGRELGVRYVLEGSVQRERQPGARQRPAHRRRNRRALWAERFDKPLADLFKHAGRDRRATGATHGLELVPAEARRAERAPQKPRRRWIFISRAMARVLQGDNPRSISTMRAACSNRRSRSIPTMSDALTCWHQHCYR